jgi:hypothetical protein
MKTSLRKRIVATALAGGAAVFSAGIVWAQSDMQHQQGSSGMQGGMGQGTGGMGGMGGMQACPMMQGSGHGMAHLPPGNEKLEMQMHADMMRAMSDILSKYAARLPDKK